MADETERELLTAQGAGGMGPAHGQAPPEAAQGVQSTQNSPVLSLTHTSADLVGSMAKESERELSTAQGAGGMGLAWPGTARSSPGSPERLGASSDMFGSMADETENQVPKIPNPDRTETRQEVVGSSWG
jgi:hypothetical protein